MLGLKACATTTWWQDCFNPYRGSTPVAEGCLPEVLAATSGAGNGLPVPRGWTRDFVSIAQPLLNKEVWTGRSELCSPVLLRIQMRDKAPNRGNWKYRPPPRAFFFFDKRGKSMIDFTNCLFVCLFLRQGLYIVLAVLELAT